VASARQQDTESLLPFCVLDFDLATKPLAVLFPAVLVSTRLAMVVGVSANSKDL
jgi:hypothetical protein